MSNNDQERNFRTHYYEKVGFRAVEEKKSLETLLKEEMINKEKLLQFCLRFGIPAMYRTYVWKILLGILPLHQPSQDYVWGHRSSQVAELERAAVLLRPKCLDQNLEYQILTMRLIDDGTLPIQDTERDPDPHHQYFMSIAQAVSSLTSSETDLFWIASRFFQHIKDNMYSLLPQFPGHTLQCLRKEDVDPRLYHHLCELKLMESPLLSQWFHTCFASVLPESALERIWDRVIAGSSHILVYVAVAILLTLRRPLLALTTTQDMCAYLRQIPEDCGDRIVNEALDLLQKYMNQPPGKSDSPAGLSKATNDKFVRGLVESKSNSSSSKSITIEIAARKSPITGDKAG